MKKHLSKTNESGVLRRLAKGSNWQQGFIKLSKNALTTYLIIFFAFSSIAGLFLFNPFGTKTTEAAWFNDDWGYRKEVPITANAAADTNAFFSFTLDTATLITAGQLQSSCQDIRVTDVNGNLLAYHVGRTNACNNAATTIDALAPYAANGGVPTLPAGASTFYVYYGNPSVSSKDQGAFTQSEAASYTVGTLGSAVAGPPPTLYWKFDDAQGTNAEDSTANGLDGTLSNGPAYQTENFCISSKCLYFAGSDDNVNKTDDAKLDFVAADNFTVSAWVKRNGASATNSTVILQKSSANIASTFQGYKLYMDDSGDLCFTTQDGTLGLDSACTSGVDFDDDAWHFVSGVKAGTTSITLYVDGLQRAQDTSIASTGTLANASTFRVGIDSDGLANEWLGYIDEVKVFRDQTARTAAQVAADFNARSNPEGVAAALGANTQNMPGALSNGLVGYWKMDESGWTNDCATEDILDSSGNANNGESCPITTGPDPSSTAKFGNAGLFDGSDDYVMIDDSTSLNPSTYSVSFWVRKVTEVSDFDRIVQKHDAGLSDGWTALFDNSVSNKKVYFSLTNTSDLEQNTLSVANSFPTLEWRHYTFTFDGTAMKQYENGVLLGSVAFTGTVSSSALAMSFAASASGTATANINLDQVRFYNRPLSQAEVSQLYNWAPRPIGYWKMDEGSGTTLTDVSGNANNGSLNTAVFTNGKFGEGVISDGSATYATIPDTDTIDFTTSQDFSVGFWFKDGGGNAESDSIVEKWAGADGYSYAFRRSGNTVNFLRYDGTNNPSSIGTTNLTSGWHYIMGVKDGSTLRLYVDGVQQDSDTDTTSGTTTNASTICIGARCNPSNYFSGSVDDVKIYNYTRSAGQVIEDMNAGHPAPGSPVGTPLGHWRFDEGYSTTAYDSGSSKVNGTLTGSPAWTNSGKFGKALTFDGTTNQYVSMSGSGALQDATDNSFTLSAWVKPNGVPANTDTSNVYGFIVARPGFHMHLSYRFDQTMFFSVRNTSDTAFTAQSTSTYATGSWYHVVGVWDVSQNKIYLYVNGILAASTTTTGTPRDYTTSNYFIGKADTGACTVAFMNCLNGNVDEPKIYNFALTPEQVKLDFNRGASQVMGALGTASDTQPNAAANEYCPPDSTAAVCTGPVGEWKLDEGTGTSAQDTSGNANTGTITAGTGGYVNGKVNKAYNFDGSTTDVNIANESNFDFERTNLFSASAWVKPNLTRSGAAAFKRVVSKRGTVGAATPGWEINAGWDGTSKTLVRITLVNDSSTNNFIQVTGSIDLPNNQWAHISMTYSGSSAASGIKLYINGIQDTLTVGQDTLSASILNDINLRIGSQNSAINYFSGNIDQVRVFNYARSAAQVAWDYNKGAPVGLWRMDECQGTSLYDASGNSNTGTLTATSTVGTCTTASTFWGGSGGTGAGKRNYAPTFNGTGDYVSSANNALNPSTSDFSASVWFKTSDVSTQQVIISQLDGSGTGRTWLEILTSKLGTFVGGSSSLGATTLSNSTWYHGVVTKSGTSLKVYLNGNLDGTGTQTAESATGVTRIGASKLALLFFNGQIDDARVYNYPLTATQVKILYNDGAARYGPTTGAP